MLTKYQTNELENLQKKCLRMMYGYRKSYEELLQESGLQKLSVRRQEAVRKFAQKTSENSFYSYMFPKTDNARDLRSTKTFVEKFARSNRLYNSPLYYMRRLLNNTADSERNNNPMYVDLSHLFNAP